MKNMLRGTALVILMLLLAGPLLAQGKPEDLVNKLYKEHLAGRGPWLTAKAPLKMYGEYFDPILAKKLHHAQNVPYQVIDADPLLDAQDDDVKSVAVKRISATATTADLSVSFVNFGTNVMLRFSMKKLPAGWRIANITYPDGRKLLAMLKD